VAQTVDSHLASIEPFEWGYGSTPRTAKLRDALVWKAAVVKDYVSIAMGLKKCTYRQGVRINMDRARLVTEAYRDTVGLPWALCRAEAVKRMCEEMPIYIAPGELIVGDPNGAPDEIRWHPEIAVAWTPEAFRTGGFSHMANEMECKEVEEICEFWQDKASAERIKKAHPSGMQELITTMATSVSCLAWEGGRGVVVYDFEALYKEGLEARIAVAEAKLAELDNPELAGMSPAEYLEKKNTLEAMILSGKAIIHYAERNAQLAREQAEEEQNPARRAELKEMAEILDRVPAKPVRTFHEALQFYWILEVVGHYLNMCGNGSGQRIDQIWWPYYKADIEAGRITREEAVELVECLFLKIQGLGSPLENPVIFSVTTGIDVIYTAQIGGSDGFGNDLSNELTLIAMEALANLHVNQPPLALRYHKNISQEVIDGAIELDRVGMGHPSWFNEELLETWALSRGYSPEESKKAGIVGCVNPYMPGNPNVGSGLNNTGGFMGPKLLEETLGLWEPIPVPGIPKLANPTEMKSIDELYDAYMQRLEFHVKVAVSSWNIGHEIIEQYLPDPCNSFLLDECLERVVDLHTVAKEKDTYPNFVCFGGINTSNAFAAMEKLIFQEGKYTMEQLLEALRANWEGFEVMQKDFLRAPKFGNDDDFADAWAVKYMKGISDTAGGVKDAWGHPCTFDGSTAAAYQVVGLCCGATPDGRFAMDSFADGTISPMFGTDTCGPTASLNSIAKIPYVFSQLVNQRFAPAFLEGKNKQLFADYIRAWYEKGTISHIQFNIVNDEILRDAQEHPERYTDLQVRVAGYSAFWIDLPKQTQNTIIARSEHVVGGS